MIIICNMTTPPTLSHLTGTLSTLCAAMEATMVVMATTSSLASCIVKWAGFSVPFGSSIWKRESAIAIQQKLPSNNICQAKKKETTSGVKGRVMLVEEVPNKRKAHLTIGHEHMGSKTLSQKFSSSIRHILETVWYDYIKRLVWSAQERLHQSSVEGPWVAPPGCSIHSSNWCFPFVCVYSNWHL